MPRRSFEVLLDHPSRAQTKARGKEKERHANGRSVALEIGDKRLYSIQAVRNMLEEQSRKPFTDFLALLLGAHPTEQNILDFANRNPDKWGQAVSTFAKLTGYKDELELTVNVYAQVKTMSDMDLEHQLRDRLNKVGDSYLVDPAEITTPYKRIGQDKSAVKRILNGRKRSVP